MDQSEAAKLRAYLQRWRLANPYRWQQGAQVVANDLALDTAFTDIKLAGFLESPDGAVIAQVVQSILPFPGNLEATVMIDAIKVAASKRTSGQKLGVLLVGALVVVILWGIFGDG